MRLPIENFMTTEDEFQKRLLPVDLILTVGMVLLLAGGLFFAIYALTASPGINTLAIPATLLVGLGGIALLWALAVRIIQHNRHRKLTGYGCRRCGYEPRVSDIHAGKPYPCPICGQPQYDKA